MNVELLAAFVAGLSDGERRELLRTLRTGYAAETAEAARTARRRDGLLKYSGDVVRALVAVLAGRFRQGSGPPEPQWVTVAAALAGAGVPDRTLRHWRKTGRVRSRPAMVHLDDVMRELKR